MSLSWKRGEFGIKERDILKCAKLVIQNNNPVLDCKPGIPDNNQVIDCKKEKGFIW